MNDEQIIQLFFTRDEDALRQTDCRYGALLRRLSENIIRNKEDAQECVNDTYLKAWETIPPARPSHFFAYLAKICRNLAFDRLDWNNAVKRKAEVVALTQEMEECIPGAMQNENADGTDISRLVGAFLQGQARENRMIFVRRYWYGDSVSEIAQRFEISQSAVLMRLSRTRSKLASYLKKEGISV